MHADRGEREEEHGAELVVGALQAHGGGGEGGAAAEAVEPHVRLDELVLAQLGHLEHEVQRPADFPDDGLVAEDDGPRSRLRPADAEPDAADDHRVEEEAHQRLGPDHEEGRPGPAEVRSFRRRPRPVCERKEGRKEWRNWSELRELSELSEGTG